MQSSQPTAARRVWLAGCPSRNARLGFFLPAASTHHNHSPRIQPRHPPAACPPCREPPTSYHHPPTHQPAKTSQPKTNQSTRHSGRQTPFTGSAGPPPRRSSPLAASSKQQAPPSHLPRTQSVHPATRHRPPPTRLNHTPNHTHHFRQTPPTGSAGPPAPVQKSQLEGPAVHIAHCGSAHGTQRPVAASALRPCSHNVHMTPVSVLGCVSATA